MVVPVHVGAADSILIVGDGEGVVKITFCLQPFRNESILKNITF